MSAPLLDVSGLAAGYGDLTVLAEVDLQVRAGEIVALIGSNGAGKSTLLRALSGLVSPTAGGIRLDGADVRAAASRDLVGLGLVHVPEGRRLFASLSIADNLRLGAYARRDGRAAIARDVARMYELFPRLAERRRQDASTLSGGEQQMCAIARGLMARPRLLMIDELSLGLAPNVVEDLVETLRRVNGEGLSLLLVEQDVVTALELSSRAYVLDQGRIVLHGASVDLARDPSVRKAYLGDLTGAAA
ncbi:ABC transporter ATP-binding protein [Methylopila henanensis]|uniref:ABC transporter ATP-binding protein n=1 Tax=Methylopila henanensis TaxID=873516 RepID=A0ABW4K7N3_9HYPH